LPQVLGHRRESESGEDYAGILHQENTASAIRIRGRC
jgi:hypothetical protein